MVEDTFFTERAEEPDEFGVFPPELRPVVHAHFRSPRGSQHPIVVLFGGGEHFARAGENESNGKIFFAKTN